MPPAAPSTARCWRAASLDTYYGQSHVLRGVSLRIARRRDHRPDGPQRHGQDHADPHARGPGAAAARPGAARRRGRDAAADASPSPAAASPTCRRGAASSPASASRRTWRSPSGRGRDGRARVDHARACSSCFRAWPSGSDNRGDQLSGGEQQMLAIGRALLTNPRLLILDEATEGLAPHHPRRDLEDHPAIRATGMATLIVDKTVAAVTAIADRIDLGEGRGGVRGRTRRRSRPTPTSCTAIWGFSVSSRRRAPTQVAGHSRSKVAEPSLPQSRLSDGPPPPLRQLSTREVIASQSRRASRGDSFKPWPCAWVFSPPFGPPDGRLPLEWANLRTLASPPAPTSWFVCRLSQKRELVSNPVPGRSLSGVTPWRRG